MIFRKRNSIYMAASGPRPCSRTSGPEMIQSAAFYHTLPVVWVLLDPDSCVTPPPSNECGVFWMSRNIPEICLSYFLCCLQRVPFESKSNIKNVLTHSKLYSKFNFQIVALAFKQCVWKVIWLLPRKICSGAMFHILDLQKCIKMHCCNLNANLRKQCANLINMPDWPIWIKRSEIKWRKNICHHLDMSKPDCLWTYIECQIDKFDSMN